MFWKKRKSNEKTQKTSMSNQIYGYEPSKLLEKVKILSEEGDFETIKKIIKILTEYISLKESSENLLNRKYSSKTRNDMFLQIFHKMCLSFDVELTYSDFSKEFNITEQNLILDTWNNSRIISNLKNINDQNILKPVENINNYYVYPLDIVLCMGGNHSQLAAKIQNKGVSHISRVVDLSCLYPYIFFDGEKFVDIHKINKFWYIGNELELYSGVFFEIGRILKKNSKYFESNLLETIN